VGSAIFPVTRPHRRARAAEPAHAWHRCACCTKPIRPGLLLCARHWHQLPPGLQRDVNRAWRALISASSRGRDDEILHHARLAYEDVREQAVDALSDPLATGIQADGDEPQTTPTQANQEPSA